MDSLNDKKICIGENVYIFKDCSYEQENKYCVRLYIEGLNKYLRYKNGEIVKDFLDADAKNLDYYFVPVKLNSSVRLYSLNLGIGCVKTFV